MSESLLDLTVVRVIPPEVITGLVTGQYKLYGGVIRWARGTEFAGQIVRHLVPIGEQSASASILEPSSNLIGIINSYQLRKLSSRVDMLNMATQQVLQMATGTMVLSGFNLVVTAVGFAVLNQKLNKLEGKLNEIQKEIKAIRTLLELEERAKLAAALRDLMNIMEITNPGHRHTMLFNSKNVLAPISLKYKELLIGAETLETVIAYEEYFCLTSLAHARCLAELGMLSLAQRDLMETTNFWQSQARRIVNDFLLGKYPERFLFSDFVQTVPISTLVSWLDFAYGEEKGYDWVDELRSKTLQWYTPQGYPESRRGPGQVISSFKKLMTKQTSHTKATTMTIEKEKIIPSFHKLVARNNVFEGYITQYELLAAHNVTPSEFESKIAALAPTAVDGYLILEPALK